MKFEAGYNDGVFSCKAENEGFFVEAHITPSLIDRDLLVKLTQRIYDLYGHLSYIVETSEAFNKASDVFVDPSAVTICSCGQYGEYPHHPDCDKAE